MKFYSELTKTLYDSKDELDKAENEYNLVIKEKEDKASQKKKEAQEVLDAYKDFNKVVKECQAKVKAAEDLYITRRNAFIKKYGNWHMSYSDIDGVEEYSVNGFIYSCN